MTERRVIDFDAETRRRLNERAARVLGWFPQEVIEAALAELRGAVGNGEEQKQ